MLKTVKSVKPKTYLILGLIVLIVILIIISFLAKARRPKIKPPSPTPFSSTSPFDEEIRKEKIDDPSIGQEVEKFYSQKPWLKNLPLVTNSYVVVYDWQKMAIRARIIIKTDSPLSREKQISQIKNSISKKLKKIGVDLNKEKLYYTFTP